MDCNLSFFIVSEGTRNKYKQYCFHICMDTRPLASGQFLQVHHTQIFTQKLHIFILELCNFPFKNTPLLKPLPHSFALTSTRDKGLYEESKHFWYHEIIFSVPELEYSKSFPVFEKIVTATLASQRTASSRAFLSNPARLFENVYAFVAVWSDE